MLLVSPHLYALVDLLFVDIHQIQLLVVALELSLQVLQHLLCSPALGNSRRQREDTTFDGKQL